MSSLDPKYELHFPSRRAPMDDAAYVRLVVDTLADLGAPPWERYELAGVAALETGWGESPAVQAPFHNHVGVKYKREIAIEYRRRVGKPIHYVRAKGHVASGDSPEVVYLCFATAPLFWQLWYWRHVGERAGVAPFQARYAAAGRLFHAHDPAWLGALLRAEYRGRLTARIPARFDAAVSRHVSIVARCKRLAAP